MYVDTDVFALDHAPDIFALYNDLDAFKSPEYRKYRCSSNRSIEIMVEKLEPFKEAESVGIKIIRMNR